MGTSDVLVVRAIDVWPRPRICVVSSDSSWLFSFCPFPQVVLSTFHTKIYYVVVS